VEEESKDRNLRGEEKKTSNEKRGQTGGTLSLGEGGEKPESEQSGETLRALEGRPKKKKSCSPI